MQNRLLDGMWPAHAWSREWTPAVARPVAPRQVRSAPKDSPGAPGQWAPGSGGNSADDPDFSEEFGAGRGFAGGSGFRYGEFERWV